QALPAEVLGCLLADAVERLRRRRLVRDVQHLRQVLLHAEGQLERLDGPVDVRAVRLAFERIAVERLDEVELYPLCINGLLGVADVAHAGAGSRATGAARGAEGPEAADGRALVDGRQEGTAVVGGAAVLQRRADGDE